MADTELHSGHRSRLCAKANLMGLEFLEEHEQLEKLLFAVIPRGNTNGIAHALLDEFGSLYGVLTAERDRLLAIDGVGTKTAEFLHDLMPLLGIVERCMLKSDGVKAVLDTPEKIGEFAVTFFNGKVTENLYMLSLDSAMRLIRFDKISEGSSTSASVSVHNITKRALLNEAYAVVLCHNHPGGRCEPSRADIILTREVAQALQSIDIRLIDHIIVACGKYSGINNMI